MNFVFVKEFQEPIQLSDAHPFDQIYMLREHWIGLACKCGRNYFLYARFSRRISEQSGIHAVSSDNSENVWNTHAKMITARPGRNEARLEVRLGEAAESPSTTGVAREPPVRLRSGQAPRSPDINRGGGGA